jgi:hypothetical protein
VFSLDRINTFRITAQVKSFNSVPLSNPIANSYFDNFRFNNADSRVYGLAKRNSFDSVTLTDRGELYLARINSHPGVISQIFAEALIGEGVPRLA